MIKYISFLIILIISVLFVTGCQPSYPPIENDDTTDSFVESDKPTDSSFEIDEPAVLTGEIRDENLDFGFGFVVKAGQFAKGERMEITFDLTNQMDSSYTWHGSYSDFRPSVKFVCTPNGEEYVILPEETPSTDDYNFHEVKPGEKRSCTYYFNIPADAVSGDYTLICSFLDTKAEFEGMFKLN